VLAGCRETCAPASGCVRLSRRRPTRSRRCAPRRTSCARRAKRDAVLATASDAVDQAQASLETAQGALVGVCGLERAAALLGIDASKLGKCVGTRRARAVES
jgi:hypothetical protein